MTAEEMAREVVKRFDGVGDAELSFPDHQWLTKEIAQAITAFAEECATEAVRNAGIIEGAILKRIKLARAEALEETAKIAEFHSGPSIQLAEKIRALKEKP